MACAIDIKLREGVMVGASYIQAIKSVATVMPYSPCSHFFLCIALHIPPFPTTIVAICMCIVLLFGTCMHSYSDNVHVVFIMRFIIGWNRWI